MRDERRLRTSSHNKEKAEGSMGKVKHCFIAMLGVVMLGFLGAGDLRAEEIDCLQCHEDLVKDMTVHPAVQMGCVTCHSGIDASEIPHKKTTSVEKGLSAPSPDLCYGCHDKAAFTHETVHPALMMGCSSCHNPHASKSGRLLKAEMPELCFNCHDKTLFSGEVVHAPIGIGLCSNCHSPHSSANEKLLLQGQPDLCYTCHDRKEFERKNVHAPVQGGMCLSCHKPHASANKFLIVKQVNDLCLECHSDVRKQPHAIAGFSAKGHPLGGVTYVRDRKTGKKTLKTTNDPVRPGKIFYCGSCHDTHSSDYVKLFRYEAQSGMGLCTHCHRI